MGERSGRRGAPRHEGTWEEVTSEIVVGIIANPASARDVRRLVAHGGAVTTHDKLNRLQRVLAGLAAAGVDRVISMADRGGIMDGLRRLSDRTSAEGWPMLEFVDQPITHSALDTTAATRAMVDAGAGAIVVLGGDGTNRVVASASADVPLVSISTGTNNAFPRPVEPTVAGLAAGLVAVDERCRAAGTYRAKKMTVRCGTRLEDALVDLAISSVDRVGSGAVWDVTSISELFLCFAEADAIGLSAIGGHLQPTSRRHCAGLRMELGMPSATVVHPPIAPGLLEAVGVRSVSDFEADAPITTHASNGVVAIDGERMFRFGPNDRPMVTLHTDGPVVVDVAATLAHAARHGLLADSTSSVSRSAIVRPTAEPPTPNTTNNPTEKGSHRATTESTRALHRDGPHQAVRIAHLAGVSR